MTARKTTKRNKKRTPSVKHRVSNRSNGLAYEISRHLPFFNELRNLILKISPPSFPRLEKSIRKIGRLKLVAATGAFLNLNNSRIDLLLIGDDIDYKKLNNFIKNLEAEMGLELRYVIMGTDEFVYRYNMFDRFTRDILDSPHKKVINKIKGLVA